MEFEEWRRTTRREQEKRGLLMPDDIRTAVGALLKERKDELLRLRPLGDETDSGFAVWYPHAVHALDNCAEMIALQLVELDLDLAKVRDIVNERPAIGHQPVALPRGER